jgi:hypothetical protein
LFGESDFSDSLLETRFSGVSNPGPKSIEKTEFLLLRRQFCSAIGPIAGSHRLATWHVAPQERRSKNAFPTQIITIVRKKFFSRGLLARPVKG